MSENLEKNLAGSIGYFCPRAGKPSFSPRGLLRGYLRLTEAGVIEISALDEDPHRRSGEDISRMPRSIAGITPHSGVLALQISGQTRSLLSSKASVRSFRARAIVSGIDAEVLQSDRSKGVTALFPGIGDWAGVSAVTHSMDRDKDNRLKAWSVRLESPGEVVGSVSGGRRVAMSAHWRVHGPDDRKILDSPVSFTCTANSPKPAWELLQPLFRVQDLMSLAYGGFVAADRAMFDPDTVAPPGARPEFWQSHLMHRRPGAPVPRDDFPMFVLSTIGGYPGLLRWVNLGLRYPRAIRPVVEHLRQGRASAPVRILEIAAGVEYWVKLCRKTAKWANKPKKLDALVDHVGSAFAEWVGDPHKWAELFWGTYNRLKHEPDFDPDESELEVLAESGFLLLSAALLNRVACSKEPSRRLFGPNHMTWQTGSQVKQLVT